jgi:hypothetical protein
MFNIIKSIINEVKKNQCKKVIGNNALLKRYWCFNPIHTTNLYTWNHTILNSNLPHCLEVDSTEKKTNATNNNDYILLS